MAHLATIAIPLRNADREYARCTIVLLIVISFILKVAFISGTLGSDDVRYFEFAQKLAHLEPFKTLDHAGSRVAFLVMIGLPGALTGQLVFSSLASALVATLTECLVALTLWRTLGPRPAFLATLFLALSGVSLTYSGALLPDASLGLFFWISCHLCARLSDVHNAENSRLAFQIGIAMGLAYSTKDTGVLLLPPVLTSIALVKGPFAVWTRASLVATAITGFFVVWLLECTVLWLYSGNFLYRYSAIEHVHNASMGQSTSLFEFAQRGYWNLLDIANSWDFLAVPVFLGVGSVFVLLTKRGPHLAYALAILFCGTYLFLGTSSLTRLVTLPFQERYIQPLLPLIAVGTARLFHAATTKRRLYLSGVLLLIAHATVSLAGTLDRVGNRYFESYVTNAQIGVTSLAASTSQTIYMDQRTKDELWHLLPEEEWRTLEVLPNEGQLPNGIYVIHPGACCQESRARLESMPQVLKVANDQRPVHRYLPRLIRSQVSYPATFHLVSTAPDS